MLKDIGRENHRIFDIVISHRGLGGMHEVQQNHLVIEAWNILLLQPFIVAIQGRYRL